MAPGATGVGKRDAHEQKVRSGAGAHEQPWNRSGAEEEVQGQLGTEADGAVYGTRSGAEAMLPELSAPPHLLFTMAQEHGEDLIPPPWSRELDEVAEAILHHPHRSPTPSCTAGPHRARGGKSPEGSRTGITEAGTRCWLTSLAKAKSGATPLRIQGAS